jgi:hypothetical protein
MRSLFGLLLVPALAFGVGACADEPDRYLPNIPQPPDVAQADEPAPTELTPNERVLERAPSADIDQDAVIGSAYDLGRLARARLDRLRAAGLVH